MKIEEYEFMEFFNPKNSRTMQDFIDRFEHHVNGEDHKWVCDGHIYIRKIQDGYSIGTVKFVKSDRVNTFFQFLRGRHLDVSWQMEGWSFVVKNRRSQDQEQ